MGALQNQELLDMVKAQSILIFIRPDFELLFRRLINNKKRPLVAHEWAKNQEIQNSKKKYKKRIFKSFIIVRASSYHTTGRIQLVSVPGGYQDSQSSISV